MKLDPSEGFLTTVSNLRGGATLNELDAALAEVVKATVETGRRGKLTLNLEIAPVDKANREYLRVVDAVAAKPAAPDRAVSLFFPTEEGGLTRKNPQMSIDEAVKPAEPEKAGPVRAIRGGESS
jgi:hypothetical protein